MSFNTLDLDDRLHGTLEDLGYRDPTQIQVKAIPAIQAGNDVLGIAQTGTGKTAAFCLPILDTLLALEVKAESRKPRVLILAPTRELASQIRTEITKFTKNTKLRNTSITGGVSQRPQIKAMQNGVELLVATPGRLLDLATSNYVNLSAITHFVLDEADQLLDMGFIRDIKKILNLLPKQRQSLLFSATMPKEVEKLAASILTKPVRIDVSPKVVTVKKVEQRFVEVPSQNKQSLLQELLTEREVRKAIVFTRTKHGANKVAKKLEKTGVGVEVIHGNKSQNARNRALESFKSGQAWVLVATDVAARGIDIEKVSHVINFDVPHEPEIYVHRIGRTARAGASGVAWTLVDSSEKNRVRGIQRLTKMKPVWLKSRDEPIAESQEEVEEEQVARPNRKRRRRSRRRTPPKAA